MAAHGKNTKLHNGVTGLFLVDWFYPVQLFYWRTMSLFASSKTSHSSMLSYVRMIVSRETNINLAIK